MDALYTASVKATAGRAGNIKSDDGVLNMPLAMPKAMGGPGGEATNPEQLFAAGFAACFGSAVMMVARQKKLDVGDCVVEAKVSIGKDDTSFALSVELVGHFSKIKGDEGHKLMEAAHQVCPYSKATRNNVPVKLSVA